MARHEGSAEDRLIARYFKPLAKHPGAFGLADDAAAITPPAGHDLVLKTDGLIAGVHFFPDDPADGVARKALRVNLSDLAAKGAAPLGFLLSIALPKDFREDWLAEFARGLGEDADAYNCPLLGGDTDSTPGPDHDLHLGVRHAADRHDGEAQRREGRRSCVRQRHDRRCGARAARAQGRAGAMPSADHLVSRYRLPQPRNALAEAVRTHASAAMDVSDGLAGDLAKLCRASDVSADIEVARVPLSDAAARALAGDCNLIEPILTGGEDYEILCAVAAGRVAAFTADGRQGGRRGHRTSAGSSQATRRRAFSTRRAGRLRLSSAPRYSHF